MISEYKKLIEQLKPHLAEIVKEIIDEKFEVNGWSYVKGHEVVVGDEIAFRGEWHRVERIQEDPGSNAGLLLWLQNTSSYCVQPHFDMRVRMVVQR